MSLSFMMPVSISFKEACHHGDFKIRGPKSYLAGHMTGVAGSWRHSVRTSEERPTCQLELRTSQLQGNVQSLEQAVIGGERGKSGNG